MPQPLSACCYQVPLTTTTLVGTTSQYYCSLLCTTNYYDHNVYDGKILCVPDADPRQDEIRSIRQIAASQLEDVAEFFRTYRTLQGSVVSIDGWRDRDAVQPLLDSCINAAN